eukprot:CAMPEP_0178398424 /NCGR_PEP_ID=MMETSP0689_2-20121128/14765_1 /TAXON_ID=160604 /ORGANISM="Amphidinium massartii, Strain CS-259" /LENGTH=298 /DNA_ID=CAMNT_0020019185 /DNA_START=74 /DNA_END=970 /DNA_ORIENTATION=-
MCKWYCTSSGPSTNLVCLNCGAHYCGACLHGDGGKMESLIKCARCGKKPQVKSNADRGAWSAVNNHPMTHHGGPRYDHDDGQANSVFTSGLRATGANESNAGAQQRTAAEARSSSKGSANGGTGSRPLRGPERFFYDKSTYTGTHSQGGPEHVAKGGGTHADDSWKRPDPHPILNTSAAEKLTMSREVSNGGNAMRPTSSNGSANGRSGSKGRASNTLATAGMTGTLGSARTPSKGTAEGRSGSKGSANGGTGSRPLRGPERFFYDKSTYTGTHVNGGPASVAKGGGTGIDQSWKRPY